jgi:3-hydroxy-3-methylglutaryl CoA synthase
MVIFSAIGWAAPAAPQPGEKAVANYDEDSISMGVAAAIDCLNGFDREKIEGLYLATTTSPYKERQGAGIVATALDLRPDIRTADFTDSLKAGTIALNSALDAIKGGSAKNVMVVASDSRLGAGAGLAEQAFGDGAAALLLGDEGVIASLEGSYSITADLVDVWRSDVDTFVHTWEDRFIRDEGYMKLIPEAASKLMAKYNLGPTDFAKVAFYGPDVRTHGAIARRMGLTPEQVQDPLLNTIGNTGAASSLMMLVAALEDAKPGDKILVVSYGNGSDAVYFQVTDAIEKARDRKAIKKHLASKKQLTSYEKYARFRETLPIELTGRAQAPTASMSALWREHRGVTSLVGAKCKKCGAPQYPAQRICANPDCKAIDEMEPYRFSDKKARLFTYTGDNLAFSADPPQVYGMLDFEGGGRSVFDVTDCVLEELSVDMPVEMSFRRMFRNEAQGVSNYWWKAAPPRG